MSVVSMSAFEGKADILDAPCSPLMTQSGHCCELIPLSTPGAAHVFHELVRRLYVRSILWEPEFGRALELLQREAYDPPDRPHRLTVEIEPHQELRAAQCGGDCEKAFTRTTPPTIRASPISAGTSSVCRNQNHPIKTIKTMPRPAHMA
jgi:hypothetical protein